MKTIQIPPRPLPRRLSGGNMASFSMVFLGTGAADSSPLLETEFSDRFDRDTRRCSSLLIDGHILVDCGPHVPSALKISGISPAAIDTLLITHNHRDHYDPRTVELLARGGLDIYCAAGTDPICPSGANITELQNCGVFTFGGMSVQALPANHCPFAVHYLFERDGKSVFYGCDGAWLLRDSYYALRGKKLDMMILDATVGDYEGDWRMAEHNSVPMIRLMLKSFANFDITRPDTRLVLSHMSRALYGGKSHAQVAAALEPEGFTVAFDGLRLEI